MISPSPDMSIEDGLTYILNHFQDQRLYWPRTISTKSTTGKQKVVYSQEEALTYFKAADILDCRISAYLPGACRNASTLERFQGIHSKTPSNIVVMIDLDRQDLKSDRSLELALSRTLDNIKKLDTIPTVIWSGRGYHVVLVLDSNGINLESQRIFTDLSRQPSRDFLRFAEIFLSNGKSDSVHYTVVSFNNCMLRVPGSINSKNGQMVRVIQEWNGIKPRINYLLADFCIYLTDQRAKELTTRVRSSNNNNRSYNSNSSYTISWIEYLLQTPIDDHRKFIVWMILPQYLINCRKLSHNQAYNIVKEWLQECDKLKRLDQAHTKEKLKAGFEAADKGFRPISIEKMIVWKPRLYELVKSRI